MTEDVVAWLRELGLSQYASVLAANEFDTLEDVASLTADDLTELGITKVGARKKLLAASSALLLNGVDRNNYYQQLAQKFANERKSNPGTPTPPRPSSLPSVASPIAYTKTPSKSSSLSYSRDNDISPSITKSPNADGWVDDFLNSKSIVSPLTNTGGKQNTTQEEKKTNHVNEINHQPTKNQINHLPSTSKMVAELSPSQFPSLGLMFHALPTNTTGLVYLDHLQHATGFQNVKTPDQILQKNNQYSALDTMFHLLPDINKNMKGLETLKRSSKIPESQQQDTKRKQSMTDTLPVNEVEDKLILAVNKENQTLEELLDEASNLLVDNPNSPRVRMMGSAPIREIRPLPMTVADIRKRMEDRIREYEQKDNAIYNSENNTKSLSKLFNVKANKTDYHKLLADQQKQIRGMEIAHKIYRRLVDQSLNAWQSNSDTMVVGIVKDTTEIRLKRQLQKQIHLLPPDAPDMDEDGHILDVVPEDAEIAARRRVALGKIEEEIKRITNTLDNNGDGILQPDELKAAMELNESLKEQLQTIAINLAFSPENRYQTLDSSYNREVQEQLDAIAAQIDTDGDGFLSPQELKQMTEENKRKLDMMGLALKLK